MSGKGSRPRPFSIAHDEYTKRWDMIFGRDLDEEKNTEEKKVIETLIEADPKNKLDKSSTNG